jgi:Zn finger protein HypA/HybF involved in hydrogenase expression
MTHSTISKVRNYQGNNSFVNKMKEVVARYGSLTIKQAEAVEKCLNATTKVEVKELPEDIKRIVDYKGENNFVKEIASKFQKYGTLTEKQVSVAINQIQKEEDKERTIRMNWPVEGETIKITRKVGEELKKTYNLQFNPILLDITRLKAVSPKAVQFVGKMTVKRGKVCTCCGRTLTDEFSMLTGIGKLCAKHIGVEYITDRSQAERFRNEYLQRVEEIGEMIFWIPKSQIVKWDGITESIIKTM